MYLFFYCVDTDTPTSSMDTDSDGWTADAIKLLCTLHIPKLHEYNSGDLGVRRRHWKAIQEGMARHGFTSDAFNGTEKISRKWRYLQSKYNTVKDNNGKTGRNRMKFKYFEMMHQIFIDEAASNVITDPQIIESTDSSTLMSNRRQRSGDKNKKSHNELMREMMQQYNAECLRLQEEAVSLEREKISLLKELLQKP